MHRFVLWYIDIIQPYRLRPLYVGRFRERGAADRWIKAQCEPDGEMVRDGHVPHHIHTLDSDRRSGAEPRAGYKVVVKAHAALRVFVKKIRKTWVRVGECLYVVVYTDLTSV
jgi:hypothetical protein